MAVQAQQYASPNAFPDFRTRARGNALDDLPALHPRQQIEKLFGFYTYLVGQQGLNGVALSEPEIELTCNASGSRKRAREEAVTMVPQQPDQIPQQFCVAGLPKVSEKSFSSVPPIMSTGWHLSSDPSRLHGSAATSTSGRPVVAPFAQDVIALLYHQSLEMDAVIRLQSEGLREGMQEVRKRQGVALMAAVEQRVLKRLREKEAELESASRRNAELEERVRQVSAETQLWISLARNNEAIISSLRATLEQALLSNTSNPDAPPLREGFGDSEGPLFPADEGQSCCLEERKEWAEGGREKVELRRGRACRLCGEREVCVLVLPCRHLCLCKDCEPRLDTCPVCRLAKEASLLVLMS